MATVLRIAGRVGPAVAMAIAILVMSGPAGSSSTTGGVVQPLLEWLGFSPERAAAIHAAGRTVGHAVAYALFAVLALRAVRGDSPPRPRTTLVVFFLSVALASFDETLQSLAGSRSAKLTDVAIDALGAAIGLGLAALRSRRRRPIA